MLSSNNHIDYMRMLGARLQLYRISKDLTQQDLEEKSGVSVRSISRLEQGSSVQWESLCKVLIALGLDENIELLVPDQTKRPSYHLEYGLKKRKRVRKKADKKSEFKWGDEK